MENQLDPNEKCLNLSPLILKEKQLVQRPVYEKKIGCRLSQDLCYCTQHMQNAVMNNFAISG